MKNNLHVSLILTFQFLGKSLQRSKNEDESAHITSSNTTLLSQRKRQTKGSGGLLGTQGARHQWNKTEIDLFGCY